MNNMTNPAHMMMTVDPGKLNRSTTPHGVDVAAALADLESASSRAERAERVDSLDHYIGVTMRSATGEPVIRWTDAQCDRAGLGDGHSRRPRAGDVQP